MIEFRPFPKLARMRRGTTVTEKIDGTNSAVVIVPTPGADPRVIALSSDGTLAMLTQSRKRFITPGKDTDNYGFSAWAVENAHALFDLGEGVHFGEWWGMGVQRGYGQDRKRFSLFNSARWRNERPECCDVVPVLYEGPFDQAAINGCMALLQVTGSQAAPGYMNPEGVVVYHSARGDSFKITFEHDDTGKEAA